MMGPDERDLVRRIAEALERLSPPPRPGGLEQIAPGYLWNAAEARLKAVTRIARIDLGLLRNVDRQREALFANSMRFARRGRANNVLLWGAPGTGKSSLVKAVHAAVAQQTGDNAAPLALIEIQREDLASLPALLEILERAADRQFILFCDDLSFDTGDTAYKSLKAVLDGGIAGRPDNVIVYATSNRRHLLAREMIENEQATAIHAREAVDEKVSLSDRFGLRLGFHAIDQQAYLDMVRGYARHMNIGLEADELERRALDWVMQKGAQSGRIAWQFMQSLPERE